MKLLLDTHLLLWAAGQPERLSGEARVLRRGLLDNGYSELAIPGEHAIAVELLPPLHKDPFDRILLGQSLIEGITLLTADPMMARYPVPVRQV